MSVPDMPRCRDDEHNSVPVNPAIAARRLVVPTSSHHDRSCSSLSSVGGAAANLSVATATPASATTNIAKGHFARVGKRGRRRILSGNYSILLRLATMTMVIVLDHPWRPRSMPGNVYYGGAGAAEAAAAAATSDDLVDSTVSTSGNATANGTAKEYMGGDAGTTTNWSRDDPRGGGEDHQYRPALLPEQKGERHRPPPQLTLREASTGRIYQIADSVQDSFLDPIVADPSCASAVASDGDDGLDDCHGPPQSTIEVEERVVTVTTTKWDATCFKGGGEDNAYDDDAGGDEESRDGDRDTVVVAVDHGGDPLETAVGLEARPNHERGGAMFDTHQHDSAHGGDRVCEGTSTTTTEQVVQKVDKHWGTDQKTLTMRNKLREQSKKSLHDSRPPIFLLPGLASTRLVAWRFKKCLGALSSDIKVQDNVWLNINLVIRMGSVDVDCMKQCLELGLNQSDTNDWSVGCKLRPDEGLDAIASLAPGGIGADLLVGGTNTVYAWCIQWLADNLGYDVTNILGLPYDWRLSPDKMEDRDGFLSMMRRRIEAAVSSNKQPGIMVAHSMGNLIFRYFVEWLRVQMRDEVFQEYVQRDNRRAAALNKQYQHQQQGFGMASEKPQGKPLNSDGTSSWTASTTLSGWMSGIASEVDELYDWFMKEDGPRRRGDDSIGEERGSRDGDSSGSDASETSSTSTPNPGVNAKRRALLWELSRHEGDEKWLQWLESHIWTYVGLSPPMLGAVNPLRAVISGENMGLPIQDTVAREMELTFGSTHTLNPVSSRAGFCDEWDAEEWGEDPTSATKSEKESTLACLDDIMNDIEFSSLHRGDPWKDFPTLKAIMRDRIDWTTGKPMINIDIEHCRPQSPGESTANSNNPSKRSNSKIKDKLTCEVADRLEFGAKHVQDASIFRYFNELWKEDKEPLIIKKEQLEESFFNTHVNNVLNRTWDRPLIKHVIMAYGVDIPTEVGYIYAKRYNVEPSNVDTGDRTRLVDRNESELPHLKTVLWEDPGGILTAEQIEAPRGSIAETLIKKKPKREPVELDVEVSRMAHSGDGSVPYLSLSWAHTWLLHAARAKRFSEDDASRLDVDVKNALDYIHISHRPRGATDWVDGPATPDETDTLRKEALLQDNTDDLLADRPHGTRYKPEMHKYHNVGVSRTTGIEYTTTVIEAIGIEHKETTRNYDILAAVFTEILRYMHDDLGLV